MGKVSESAPSPVYIGGLPTDVVIQIAMTMINQRISFTSRLESSLVKVDKATGE